MQARTNILAVEARLDLQLHRIGDHAGLTGKYVPRRNRPAVQSDWHRWDARQLVRPGQRVCSSGHSRASKRRKRYARLADCLGKALHAIEVSFGIILENRYFQPDTRMGQDPSRYLGSDSYRHRRGAFPPSGAIPAGL